MVATSQPLASQAGVEILRRGGNAADAAVAVAAVLAVTEPCNTGLGGDAFALFYEGATGRITALNGSGRCPAALSLERLAGEGFQEHLPAFHVHTITVPGACAAWCDLVETNGTLDLSTLLAPAIRLAEEGYPVAPITAQYWAFMAPHQLDNSPGGRELLIEDRAPRAGEIMRIPTLASTLRAVAEGGKKAFYEGRIAERIVETVQSLGGVLSREDLAAHRSTWEEPISTVYKGIRVHECPPNGQGLAVLLALNILSQLPSLPGEPLSGQRLHYLIEALRLAFADTRWYVADPDFVCIPVERLLAPDYAAQRAALIHPKRATVDHRRGAPVAASDTVYFSVVDGRGNACSVVNSNYKGFGTGIVPEGTGFSLQNRGYNFSLDPGHPNALTPGKRPYHTIVPALATREVDGSLYASFGVMGGFMQPQGHVQVLLGLIEDGFDPQAALDQPRFCIREGQSQGTVAIEEGISEPVFKSLQKMGHPVERTVGFERRLFGRGQIILRDPVTGVLCGGSDPRSDGCALGY